MLNRLYTALGMACALTLVSPAFAATTIDFESTPTGSKAQGFSATGAPGLSFTSAFGTGLQVANFTPQSAGNGLGVFNDDANFLIGTFSSSADFLSLMFGNDDPCCSQAGNIALLKTFFGGNLVGSASVALNRNDLLDQTISFGQIGGGQVFDRFEFSYANAGGSPISLIEVVDNITFNTASAVPEPSTWALMLIGFGAVGGAMRSAKRKRKVTFSFA